MGVFKQGSVPVAVAAQVYGKDPSWVRAGIIEGWLPIGNATTFYILHLQEYQDAFPGRSLSLYTKRAI